MTIHRNYLLLVPAFYAAIFKKRHYHATTSIGRWGQLNFKLSPKICLEKVAFLGISEIERRQRKASNSLTTKITFVGWLLEVEQDEHFIQSYPLFPFHEHFIKQAVGVILILAPFPLPITLRCDDDIIKPSKHSKLYKFLILTQTVDI